MENPERRHYPEDLKKIAIRLYTDGVEIAVIPRSLEVSYETVRSCYAFGILKLEICGLEQKVKKQ